MSVTRELSGATAQAEAEARIRDITEKQRIEAENYAETLRIQREESQYAQRMYTRTSNFGAYQVEKQAEVGVAGANALGQMGANGAGGVDLGGGNAGFNPAAMMASMAVGGVVGQNIASAMGNMMGSTNQQTTSGAVPPPIPTAAYHVAVNGQATGPYAISVLAQMAAAGQLTADSLVWASGMSQWARAGTVDELKALFVNNTPPIPPQV